jgi:PTH2 family peptidyl-tRNA hydrolase
MPPGKLAAQATHAARLSLLRYLKHHPERLDEFIDLNSCGSMVVLVAKGLPQLEHARDAADAADLPCALFVDSAHVLPPHFDGAPVPTALAIGPAPRERMRDITKRFRCA